MIVEKKYYAKVNELGTFWHSDEAMTVFHRLDGPAVEYADGYVEYYIEGIELSEQEFLTRTQAQAPTCENKIVTIDGVDYKLVKA